MLCVLQDFPSTPVNHLRDILDCNCKYICIHVCKYVCIHVCVCMYECMHVCVCMYSFMYACMCVYVCMNDTCLCSLKCFDTVFVIPRYAFMKHLHDQSTNAELVIESGHLENKITISFFIM